MKNEDILKIVPKRKNFVWHFRFFKYKRNVGYCGIQHVSIMKFYKIRFIKLICCSKSRCLILDVLEVAFYIFLGTIMQVFDKGQENIGKFGY